MKISVIMPVLLEEWEGSSKNRPTKFIRAVDSFLKQLYDNKELIVISDGCDLTNQIVKTKYNKHLKSGLIKLVEIPKKNPREYFVGAIRQTGIEAATGNVLCNLDSDDYFLPNHLHNISVTLKTDWAYFGYYRKLDELSGIEEFIQGDINDLCTANVVWKSGLNVSWDNCDGKQDNKYFNKQLINKYPNCEKIYGCGYVVAHAVVNLRKA